MSRLKAASAVATGRALMLLCVLAGVLAMHALTTHHDAGMVDGTSSHSTMPAMADTSAGHAPAGFGPTVAAATDVTVEAAVSPMGTMCIAVLAGSLLLSILMLAWLRSHRPAPWATLRTLSSLLLPGRSPPRRTPSLSKLCVLRI